MTRRAGLAASVMLAAGALGSGIRADSVDPAIATPIEQALIEQACSTPPAIAIDPDKHDECLHAKLNAMRGDFGRDLSRLSSVDRRKIDAACEPVRGVEGREGYVSCLTIQLAAVQARWNRGRGTAVENASAAQPSVDEHAAVTTTPTSGDTPQPISRTWLIVTLTLATLGAAGAGLAFAMKARPRAPRVCRACGTGVDGAGDLCAPCRREAAEALRRAAAERVERQRITETQEREQREREEDDRLRHAQEAEEAQRQQQELIRQCEEAARKAEEDARHRHAEGAQAQRELLALDEDTVFDPYRVLDIPRDASADVIRAAYIKAKAKYDFREVEGLGDEIKQHYRQKAEAADRAVQMLIGGEDHSFESPSHGLSVDRTTGVSTS
jgi:hypothetical protein